MDKTAEQMTDEQKLIALARRTLWIAYCWNDHNFDAAHDEARATCEKLGIKSFDQANVFLEALSERAPVAAQPMTDEQIMTLALSHEAGTNWDSAVSNDPELFDTDVLFSRDDFLGFARALLSAAQPPAAYVQEWISIAEKMPKLNEQCLFATEFDGPGDWRMKAGYLSDRGFVVWGGSWTPTRWMPFPAAPK